MKNETNTKMYVLNKLESNICCNENLKIPQNENQSNIKLYNFYSILL